MSLDNLASSRSTFFYSKTEGLLLFFPSFSGLWQQVVKKPSLFLISVYGVLDVRVRKIYEYRDSRPAVKVDRTAMISWSLYRMIG